MATFYPFPRTPHMSGSDVVDEDEVVTDSQIGALLLSLKATWVMAQEKVYCFDFSLALLWGHHGL